MVELIITMAILVIIATPLAGYFVVGAQNNKLAREQMQAAQIAQRHMEELKARPLIGDFGPTNVVEGIYTVTLQAIAQNRTTNTPITNSGIQRAVEDYTYSPVQAIAGQVAVTVSDAAIGPQPFTIHIVGSDELGVVDVTYGVNDNFTVNLVLSTLDTNRTNADFTISGVAGPVPTLICSGGALPTRVVFTMNCAANMNLTTSSTGPSPVPDRQVYVFQDVNPATGANFADFVTATPTSEHIQIFENLTLSPAAGFNSNRVYLLRVSVVRTSQPLVPLIQLTSYKRIE